MSDSEDWSYASSSSSSESSQPDEESSSDSPPPPAPSEIMDPPFQTRVGPDGELIVSTNLPFRPKRVPRYGYNKPPKGKNPVAGKVTKPPKKK